jgi:hypothetical protein
MSHNKARSFPLVDAKKQEPISPHSNADFKLRALDMPQTSQDMAQKKANLEVDPDC